MDQCQFIRVTHVKLVIDELRHYYILFSLLWMMSIIKRDDLSKKNPTPRTVPRGEINIIEETLPNLASDRQTTGGRSQAITGDIQLALLTTSLNKRVGRNHQRFLFSPLFSR